MRLLMNLIAIALIANSLTIAAEPPYNPPIKPASGEGEAALKRFQLDKSLHIDLWAAEPMLANPVCFCFDGKGRCYVAETFRMKAGVTDNRDHPWLEDDLACRTVEDRVAMYRKYAKDRFPQMYERERDRIRMLEDSTGSGKADKATVFSDDFGRAEDGIGAGLLAHGGSVYYTNIPGVYRLRDTKGTGQADVKEVLSTGYGVHVSFFGHDLHGLRMGPDGRVYFSCGDRGFNVKTKEGKHLFYPDTGAVLRCEPDGSNLEVVHIGLRNPQELAFDDFGNLFTVDNNSDSGDRARLVYIVEGGDSGWRIGYQYGSSMHDSTVKQGNRGPWNYEKLWHPQHEGQPAYVLPPIANFSDGPSGLCHYPGVGLPDKYKGHFFLCDFRGNSGGSGVWSFTTKPKGASFELVNPQHFVWNILATDCDFGPDSALYVSDWTEGWGKPNKGRIYRVTDPEAQKSDLARNVKKLLADPFSERPIGSLVELLGHSHQQVRMEAQFALAAKGRDSIEPLAKVAKDSKNQLARLHAIWGITQMLRKNPSEVDPIYKCLLELTSDKDDEVRAQAANSMRVHWISFTNSEKNNGNWVDVPSKAIRRLLELLADPNPRVQYFAAMSLGTIKHYMSHGKFDWMISIDAIIKFVGKNESDPYLRHAGARAYGFCRLPKFDHSHPYGLKIADILSFRNWLIEDAGSLNAPEDEVITRIYLSGRDARIVTEAARAIHDIGLQSGLQNLAELTTETGLPVEALYRALNANFRLGKPENAAALATFAARANAPANLRVLALQMLGSWPKPPRRDYITGATQNLPPRDPSIAADALKAKLGGIFSGPAAVQKEAANVAGKLGITEVGPFLLNLVVDDKALADDAHRSNQRARRPQGQTLARSHYGRDRFDRSAAAQCRTRRAAVEQAHRGHPAAKGRAGQGRPY